MILVPSKELEKENLRIPGEISLVFYGVSEVIEYQSIAQYGLSTVRFGEGSDIAFLYVKCVLTNLVSIGMSDLKI